MFLRFRTILATLALGVGLFCVPQLVGAQSYYGLTDTAKNAGYSANETVESSVNKVVSTLLGILAIVFFILVTYAGIRWMIARGNEEQVTAAKSTLESALVGLLLVLGAYAITTFIFSRLERAPAEEEVIPLIQCSTYDEATCGNAPEGCKFEGGSCVSIN